jgi:ADP-ribosyl-[dinitrogen reductase] hydrolase
MTTLLDRYRGCLLGLACGDAVGTTVEFSPRGSFAPVTDMAGGGPFNLQAGQWTDDTSMALCMAASLTHCKGFDAVDQMNRYVNWWRYGYYSSTGECFDIGMTTAAALQRYLNTGDPVAGSREPHAAGNGSLMRLAPVVLFYHPDAEQARVHARRSSELTHAADEAIGCCELFADILINALSGATKDALVRGSSAIPRAPSIAAIERGDYLTKAAGAINGSGYCVESLEAALWCFAKTETFEQAVLSAANLGDDADTTAAIVGQLAGAHYGVAGIPAHWLEQLHMRDEISSLAQALLKDRAAS